MAIAILRGSAVRRRGLRNWRLSVLDCLVAVACFAAGLVLSRTYYLEKESRRATMLRILSPEFVDDTDGLHAATKSNRQLPPDPQKILNITGAAHASMLVYACCLLVAQFVRCRDSISDAVRRPGMASCITCVTILLVGVVILLLRVLTVRLLFHRWLSPIGWVGLIDTLELKVGAATAAIWLILAVGGSMRLRWCWLEVAGVCLGVGWILEPFVCAIVFAAIL